MALSALLLDLDGTLTESNEAHAQAFADASVEAGHPLPVDRFRREIGKGGDLLVPDVFGGSVEEERGDDLRGRAGELFREATRQRPLAILDGAHRLIQAAREHGLRLALATSSSEDDLDALMKSVGHDFRGDVDLVTTASDVDRSKPHPDVFGVAAERLGVPPSACAVVGDTVFDGQAARRAGVAFIGVATWVWSEEDLRQSGARATYASTAALAHDLGAAIREAAPGPHALSPEALASLMDAALAQAREASGAGDAPIGAAIGRGDGTVLARGRNRSASEGDRLRHAETDALHALLRDGAAEPGLLLATTLEPCAMCLGAATEAGIHAMVYALEAPPNGARGHLEPLAGRTIPLVHEGPGREASLRLVREAARARGGFAQTLADAIDAQGG